MPSSAVKPRLSLAMIVRDAGTMLTDTLRSIEDIVDEIVILDTGSTDDTLAIAASHQANVIQQTWQDDFSAARNYCWSNVTGDWILWLDAGEQLTAGDAQKLRQHIDNTTDPLTAYLLLIKVPQTASNVCGEQAGRIRLVPNLRGLGFSGCVREELTTSLAANGIKIESLPIAIQRRESEHDTQRKTERAIRNVRIAESEIQERGPCDRTMLTMADALQDLGHLSRAADVYRQSIALAAHESTAMLEAYYGLLTSLGDGQQTDEQIRVCVAALEVFPVDMQLLCALGGYLQSAGRLELASRSYETAYRFGQIQTETWHLDQIHEVSGVCFGLTLQLLGKPKQAQTFLEEAIATQPASARFRSQLIDLHLKHGQLAEAQRELDQWRSIDPGNTAIGSYVDALANQSVESGALSDRVRIDPPKPSASESTDSHAAVSQNPATHSTRRS